MSDVLCQLWILLITQSSTHPNTISFPIFSSHTISFSRVQRLFRIYKMICRREMMLHVSIWFLSTCSHQSVEGEEPNKKYIYIVYGAIIVQMMEKKKNKMRSVTTTRKTYSTTSKMAEQNENNQINNDGMGIYRHHACVIWWKIAHKMRLLIRYSHHHSQKLHRSSDSKTETYTRITTRSTNRDGKISKSSKVCYGFEFVPWMRVRERERSSAKRECVY